MATAKIKEIARKYHLFPKALKVRAYLLFENGLEPTDIEKQKLLPQLKSSAVYDYYRECHGVTELFHGVAELFHGVAELFHGVAGLLQKSGCKFMHIDFHWGSNLA